MQLLTAEAPRESSSCERPRDSFPELTHFYEMGTHNLLVFLEPLSVFQDKTFRGELRYFVLEYSIYRFVSNTANIQRKQIAGTAVIPYIETVAYGARNKE